jgi:transcriptional regulator with XRE-family HTH domain
VKQQRAYLPEASAALVAIGAMIGAARRRLGWTAAELGERIGSSAALVSRIERGAPGTAIGTVFEAAVVCGVPLFDVPAGDLPLVAARAVDRLALLPQRVRTRDVEVSDDF